MRALILASAVLALAAAGPGRADEKKDAANRAGRLFQIEWNQHQDQGRPYLMRDYGMAKTPADKSKVIDRLLPLGEQLVQLIEDNPTDETAHKAGVLYMKEIGTRPPTKGTTALTTRVLKALAENHADAAEISTFCHHVARNPGDDDLAFLRTVLDKAKHNDTNKGTACFLLARALTRKVDDPETPRDQAAAAEKEAKECYDRVVRDFADVTTVTTGRKLGELAKDGAYRLEKLTVGKAIPDIAGEDLDGKKQKLSDFRGKVLVVVIGVAPESGSLAMVRHQRALVERLKGKLFAMLSVSVDGKKETLTEFLAKEKLPWAHWWTGRKGNVIDELKVETVPTIYVLDAKGVIRAKNVHGESMEKAVEELLNEVEPK